MTVIQTGGVLIDGESTILGQPSPSPNVRSDVAQFNAPFDRDVFTQMIEGPHGYNVLWEKGQYCPFLKGPSPRDHDINCKICINGFVYFDAVKTKMLLVSMGLSQQYYAYGRFDTGRVYITALPEMKISFWDR